MKEWVKQPDNGIEYYYHPFFDENSFYHPDRRVYSSPFNPEDSTTRIIPVDQYQEKLCSFCLGRRLEGTPEKSYSAESNGKITFHNYPGLEPDPHQTILFRRQANLFEIISFEYWQNKYNISPTPQEEKQLNKAIENPYLKTFIKNLIHTKLERIHNHAVDVPDSELKQYAKNLYSGFHELLISGFHSDPHSPNLFGSNNMTWTQHRISYQMLINIIQEMVTKNKYIKFIAVFQNWLAAAGASFDHWHKQILALDFWGRPLEREAELFKENPLIYTEFGLQTAIENNLLIAENEFAVAFVEVGAKTGYITICSKSHHLRPNEHSPEEVNSMSDLTHAIIYYLGNSTSYNEEWFYTPFDSETFKTPWRIIINIRRRMPAGFENISGYSVVSISPKELAQDIRLFLAKHRHSNHLAPNITIDPQYKKYTNILQY
ncbi:MAG: DUF4921 family protein [Brevinemataceae bacterium]